MRPLPRSQPPRPGKNDKNKQRHNNNSSNSSNSNSNSSSNNKSNNHSSNSNNNNNSKPKISKIDVSVVKQNVKTPINGLDKVIKVLENGTEEVISYLSHECSIIYECRVCLNLFRSVGNFISHKRIYCRKKYTDVHSGYNEQIEEKMLSITSDFQKGTLSSRSTSKRDIEDFLDSIKVKKAVTEQTTPDIFALELEATKEALFHCFRHQGKHCSEERSATLGPNGTIVGPDGNDEVSEDNMFRTPSPSLADDLLSSLTCPHCTKIFSSEKSLQAHYKTIHSLAVRTCYACPCCKKYLANAWSVYRHLAKVHKKSNEQIRKLRSQIQKKEVTDDESNKSKTSPIKDGVSLSEKMNPNDRINKDSPMHGESHQCYVCGKRFERRVVMLAHAQICRDKGSRTSCNTPALSDVAKEDDDENEMKRKRPRLDSPSPPSTPKIGDNESNKKNISQARNVEKTGSSTKTSERNKSTNESISPTRNVSEQNRSPTRNAPERSRSPMRKTRSKNKSPKKITASSAVISPSRSPVTTDLHLEPDTMALFSSMKKAVVVLKKKTDDVSTLSPSTPPSPRRSPSPSCSLREFSPRAEDIILRYRERENLNDEIFNSRRDSVSSCSKVDVESVYCSDTEDSSSGCEYVYGARDIENCIGTIDDVYQTSNCSNHQPDKTIENQINDSEKLDNSTINSRKCNFKIKEEPKSDDEHYEDESVVPEEEGEDDNRNFDEIIDEIESNSYENGKNDDPLLADEIESGSDSEETMDLVIIENAASEEVYEEEKDGEESEDEEEDDDDDGDDEEEEEENVEDITYDDEDVDDDTLKDDEDHVEDLVNEDHEEMAGQMVNGLSDNQKYIKTNNSMEKNSLANITFRKINSHIDGPKKKCLFCLKTFHRLNLVRRHVASHLNIYNFKCTIDKCDYKCFLRADMVKHLLRVHKMKEVRGNRGAYMKRIDVPDDESGRPTKDSHVDMHSTSLFGAKKRKFTENVPNCRKMSRLERSNETRSSSDLEDCNIDRVLPPSITSGMNNDEDYNKKIISIKANESLQQPHKRKTQIYEPDIDEIVVNPDSEPNDDKLREIMMQVIFGSETHMKRTSVCVNDTSPPETSSNSTIQENSSIEIGEVSATQ
ncbi:hypothetical protein O3M35_009673 [Rhynocoris fuscipes]|uniref:C2H2-type domain-containing protein n=1 Tax=Rhynocoris fuscipes TaxID=488301 RepID=A0AAW1D3V7_9HEMI